MYLKVPRRLGDEEGTVVGGKQVAGGERRTTRGHHDSTSRRLCRAEGTTPSTSEHLQTNQFKQCVCSKYCAAAVAGKHNAVLLPCRTRFEFDVDFGGFSREEKRLRSEKTGICFFAVTGFLDSRGSHKSFILGARSGSSRIRSICQGSANENQVVTSATAPDPRGGSARSKALKGRIQPRSGGSPTFCRCLPLGRPSGPNQIPPLSSTHAPPKQLKRLDTRRKKEEREAGGGGGGVRGGGGWARALEASPSQSRGGCLEVSRFLVCSDRRPAVVRVFFGHPYVWAVRFVFFSRAGRGWEGRGSVHRARCVMMIFHLFLVYQNPLIHA